jgi:hypothetical protein
MEKEMNQEGIWLSILDYANVKKTSISTIRRSIKAGHLKFKEENGKYFIWTREVKSEVLSEKSALAHKLELEFLQRQNRELQQEIEDLKMLLSVYENQQLPQLPPLPELDA